MKEYNNLVKDIKNKQFLPVYFLQGDEPFYIDKINDLLEANVLKEEEKAFNQNIVYGTESDLDQLISLAKQFPMGADKQLLVIKEAKGLPFENIFFRVKNSTITRFRHGSVQYANLTDWKLMKNPECYWLNF